MARVMAITAAAPMVDRSVGVKRIEEIRGEGLAGLADVDEPVSRAFVKEGLFEPAPDPKTGEVSVPAVPL
jgi:hypothetical protein